MKPAHVVLIIALFCSCSSIEKNATPEAASIQPMQSPADSASAEPHLFTDKNGVVYLSWIQKKGDTAVLKYASYNNGQWSMSRTIASGSDWFVNWADYPMLAADGGGNLLSHFLQKSKDGKYTYDVKITSSNNDGQNWSVPVALHDDGKKAEHGFVSIVPYGENYFVSWLDGRNAAMEEGAGHHDGHHGQMTLRGAIVDKSGKKQQEWELDDRVCDCCQTSAAIAKDGPVVIYRDRSADEVRDMSIVRYVNGAWTKPVAVHSDNWKIDGCPVNGPRVTTLGNTMAVAWFAAPAKDASVKVAFSGDGGASFSAPVRIDEGKAMGRVDIILLNENTALVSWLEGAVIKAVKLSKDGKKETPVTIASSSEARSSGFPQMTNAGKQVVFAWTDDRIRSIRVASMPCDECLP
jgi:hypothetical protein